MHRIKKYANRKLYDTTDKAYITMARLSELISSGNDVEIIDNKTGEDLTASIVSQLIARNAGDKGRSVSSGILIQLFRKGSSALAEYSKKYVSVWHSAFTMAEDEVDAVVKRLVQNRELTRSEGSRLKQEVAGVTASLKTWIAETIERRLTDMLNAMNLATKDQVAGLTARIQQLEHRLDRYENGPENPGAGQRRQKSHHGKPCDASGDGGFLDC